MRQRSMRWRLATVAALVLPLAFAACSSDDDGGPSGPDGNDIEGTWTFTEDNIASYVRITENTIQVFDGSGVCFFEFELEIESADGDVYTVNDGTGSVEWVIEKVGNNIVVEDEDGVSTTLTPSSVNTSTLTTCEPYDPEVDDFPRPACSTLPLLNVPGSVDGEIRPGDARFYDDTWFDLYRIEITEETQVSITMASDDPDNLDPYLSIYDADGVEVDDNNSYGQGVDARVETVLGPGCYYVVAGSWEGEPGDPGAGYTLTADDEFSFVFPPAPCADLEEITVPGQIASTLSEGDPRWSDGTWYEAFSLNIMTTQTVTISHTSADLELLDPYLMVYDEEGVTRIAEHDDIDYDGGDYNAQIADLELTPGCYIIVAASYQGNSVDEVGGDYTLAVD